MHYFSDLIHIFHAGQEQVANSALMCAAQGGRADCVQLLVRAGACTESMNFVRSSYCILSDCVGLIQLVHFGFAIHDFFLRFRFHFVWRRTVAAAEIYRTRSTDRRH
jgi:hypothetical protein